MTALQIGIITATRNAATHLPELVESIRQQSYQNLRWIVIDAESTDKTVQIVESSGLVSYFVSEPDHGIYDAWNKGLAVVESDWILFMGADDRFASDTAIEDAVKYLLGMSENVLWAYGSILQIGSEGRRQYFGEPWEQTKRNFKFLMNVPHQAVFHRPSLFEACGNFDPSYRIAGDYALLLKAVEIGTIPAYLPCVITHMGAGGVSNNASNSVLALRESLRARKTAGLRPLYTPLWCWVYLKSFVKRFVGSVIGENRVMLLINFYRRISGRTAR